MNQSNAIQSTGKISANYACSGGPRKRRDVRSARHVVVGAQISSRSVPVIHRESGRAKTAWLVPIEAIADRTVHIASR